MSLVLKTRAEASVIDLHELIQTVFNQNIEGKIALPALLNYFSPEFSMITIQGQLVSLEQVKQLFKGAIGARPHVVISIHDLETIHEQHDFSVIRYREVHQDQDQQSSRLSTVVVDTRDGHTRWLYLHETTIR